MTTAHHPVPTHVGFHGEHEWLWIGLSAIAVAIIAGAIMWFTFDQPGTEPATVDNVSGFEYNVDASSGQIAGAAVTSPYLGYSDELYPTPVIAEDYEYGDDATTGQTVQGSVTSDFVGTSGELDTDK